MLLDRPLMTFYAVRQIDFSFADLSLSKSQADTSGSDGFIASSDYEPFKCAFIAIFSMNEIHTDKI